MYTFKSDIDKIWNSVSDTYKENVINMYNDAHVMNDSGIITTLETLFGDRLINTYKNKFKFKPGDIVKYKSTLLIDMDQTDRFTVQYYDDPLNKLIRVENNRTHVRKTINEHNLELVK